MSEEIIDVVKVTGAKGGQMRITLKKQIAQELEVSPGDYLIFVRRDGEVLVKKLKLSD